MTSLAGATRSPLLPEGEVRIGGFGSDGLERLIRERRIEIIADATHPFAAQISAKGHAAARACGIEYIRLERPAWRPAEGDHWTLVETIAAAAEGLPRRARVFLTIGRKQIAQFTGRADLSGLIRSIEPPEVAVAERWKVLVERPPFSVEHEIALMRSCDIGVLVSKNAGGEQTAAKLVAARALRLPVVMVERPVKPTAVTLASAEEAAAVVSGA